MPTPENVAIPLPTLTVVLPNIVAPALTDIITCVEKLVTVLP